GLRLGVSRETHSLDSGCTAGGRSVTQHGDISTGGREPYRVRPMPGNDATARIPDGAVDTHCHLFLIDDEPLRVVDRAQEAGVRTIVRVGIDPRTSRRSIELAGSIPGVVATAGVHPHSASELDVTAMAEIEAMLDDPRVVGVGECGLDFY